MRWNGALRLESLNHTHERRRCAVKVVLKLAPVITVEPQLLFLVITWTLLLQYCNQNQSSCWQS